VSSRYINVTQDV